MNNINWLKEAYFAHRGFHNIKNNVPENSLSAFKEAIKYDYAIECDVRLTKDKKIVVFHDHDLKRACGKSIIIEESTLSDLQEYKLFGTEEYIPSLQNLLNLVDKKVSLLVELKTENNAKELSYYFYQEIKDYQGVFAVQSFDPRVLLWFKRHQSDILRGQIAELDKNKVHNPIFRYFKNRMILNTITNPSFINYNIIDMPLKTLDKLHAKGVPILAYTAKSQADYDFVINHYDNVMFEGFHLKK